MLNSQEMGKKLVGKTVYREYLIILLVSLDANTVYMSDFKIIWKSILKI